jgi:hypothetical protein
VPGFDDRERAVGQPFVEELCIGERYDAVVSAVDDGD